MDFEDHFTSHEYRNLYWTNFENFVEECNLSPECNQPSDTMKVTDNNENDTEKTMDSADKDSDLQQKNVEGSLDDDEIYVEQLQNDKIRIDSDNFGNLVPKAAQVMDYLHRDKKFNNICVWDFVAQVDKVKNNRKSKKLQADDIDSDDDDDDEDDLEEAMNNNEFNKNLHIEESPMTLAETRQPLPKQDIPQSHSKTRPFGELQAGHYEL
ncbi:uncharacterized protein EDB91DRAFT_1245635 [Suillus paluster]|uniref:uncharacterized protein n=1 Tax=Suillus paluster TaxID=48578 RepID=UPI001B85BE36|nr:uncharacterized protein EDB91DRAFT_1245635 [Suillus paluster]KAG1747191.1 hypothetical protein EDB91DRAFT_1245635 [Suillus paluster]